MLKHFSIKGIFMPEDQDLYIWHIREKAAKAVWRVNYIKDILEHLIYMEGNSSKEEIKGILEEIRENIKELNKENRFMEKLCDD